MVTAFQTLQPSRQRRSAADLLIAAAEEREAPPEPLPRAGGGGGERGGGGGGGRAASGAGPLRASLHVAGRCPSCFPRPAAAAPVPPGPGGEETGEGLRGPGCLRGGHSAPCRPCPAEGGGRTMGVPPPSPGARPCLPAPRLRPRCPRRPPASPRQPQNGLCPAGGGTRRARGAVARRGLLACCRAKAVWKIKAREGEGTAGAPLLGHTESFRGKGLQKWGKKARLKADAGGRGGGSAPAVALQNPWGCGGGCHRILTGLTAGFLSRLMCPIHKSISRGTSLGVLFSPGDDTMPQRSQPPGSAERCASQALLMFPDCC